jgi:hypothetical protein
MAREILTDSDIRRINSSGEALRLPADATVPAGKDKYIDRLFKYIPSEIVAGYVFVLGVLTRLREPAENNIAQWAVFVIFCLLTPLYLWRIQKVRKAEQHIISLVSFAVWVLTLGGPFSRFSWYNPIYGEILLPVFTLIIAVWEAES